MAMSCRWPLPIGSGSVPQEGFVTFWLLAVYSQIPVMLFLSGVWLFPVLFWHLVLVQFSRKQEVWGVMWGCWRPARLLGRGWVSRLAVRSWVWIVEEPVHHG